MLSKNRMGLDEGGLEMHFVNFLKLQISAIVVILCLMRINIAQTCPYSFDLFSETLLDVEKASSFQSSTSTAALPTIAMETVQVKYFTSHGLFSSNGENHTCEIKHPWASTTWWMVGGWTTC